MSIRGQGHSLTLANLNLFFFSKTFELFETKYHVKQFLSTEMKIYTNGLDHMTKMAATPIYGKKPSKISFLRTCRPFAMKHGM